MDLTFYFLYSLAKCDNIDNVVKTKRRHALQAVLLDQTPACFASRLIGPNTFLHKADSTYQEDSIGEIS